MLHRTHVGGKKIILNENYCNCYMKYTKLPKIVNDEMICSACGKIYTKPWGVGLEEIRNTMERKEA